MSLSHKFSTISQSQKRGRGGVILLAIAVSRARGGGGEKKKRRVLTEEGLQNADVKNRVTRRASVVARNMRKR